MPVTTKQHVKSSFRDAAFTSLNIGMSESYFCAFLLALGISDVVAGLGIIIPQFIGVVFQLLSIRSFFTKYSLKKRIVIFLSIQAASMIPLIYIGLNKINSPVLVISVLGIYWASLLSSNPPWNRLIGHTVPSGFRIKFFSIRSQFGQSSVFVGLLIGGFILYWAKGAGVELATYSCLFGVGLLLKCLSIHEFKHHHNDYELGVGEEKRVRLRDFVLRLKGTEQGKLITFLFFFYITVHFAAPYFNPFMLKKLGFNYLEYMTVVATSYFGRIFMFRLLQRKAKSRHIDNLLTVSAIGIGTSPLLWALSQNFWWIMGIEFLSGCYWAGFELSTILLYYQKVSDRERTSVITYITFFNTSGMVIGSILGALFMNFLPGSFDQYLTLFIVSSVLRIALVVFAPHVSFKGQIPKLISMGRNFSVRPSFGAVFRPIVGKKSSRVKKDEK